MTVENEVYREDYNGNDSTTSFPVTFYFLADEHLEVTLLDAAGVATVQVLTTDYTVLGAGEESGGSVEMIVAPATGESLTILRDVPLTQEYDYIENDNFPAESHETALDKLTMIVQQQQEIADRTVTVAPAYDTFNELTPEGDSYIVWNAAGDTLESLPFSDIQVERLYLGADIIVETFDESGASGIKIHNSVGAESLALFTNNSVDPSDASIVTLNPGTNLNLNVRNVADTDYEVGVKIEPDGAVSLYYDNSVKLVTKSDGVVVTGEIEADSVNIPVVEVTSLITQLIEPVAGKTGITLVEDGAVSLYYDENATLITDGGGITVQSALGLVTSITLEGAGAPRLGMYMNTPLLTFHIQIDDTGGTLVDGIVIVGGGEVELYYDNVVKLATKIDGVVVTGELEADAVVTTLIEPASGKTGITLVEDGAASLYHNEVKVLETVSNGIELIEGRLYVGEDDVKYGLINVYGQGTGSSAGGRLDLFTALDYDVTVDQYIIRALGDDLWIGPNTDGDALVYDSPNNRWYFRSGSVWIGESGVLEGTLNINGGPTGVPDGGLIYLHTADDYDATIAAYGLIVNEDDLWIGSDVDPDSLRFNAAFGSWEFTAGDLRIGVLTALRGTLRVFGDGAASTEGGRIRAHVATDYDSVITYHQIQVSEDDLWIGSESDPDNLRYDFGSNQWNFQGGGINVGEDGVRGGIINVGGELTGEPTGGRVNLFLADDYDTTINYYQVRAEEDDFSIGPDTDTDALTYEGDTDRWVFRSGNVWVGEASVKRGIINAHGRETGYPEGGLVRLYTADDYNTTIASFDVAAYEDDLGIGPNTIGDALVYRGGTDTWEVNLPFHNMDETLWMGADVDGSWRLIISGTDLLIQRKEASVWVTKTTVPA